MQTKEEHQAVVTAEARADVLQILTAAVSVSIPNDLIEALVRIYLASTPAGAAVAALSPEAAAFRRAADLGNLLNSAAFVMAETLRKHPQVRAAMGLSQ